MNTSHKYTLNSTHIHSCSAFSVLTNSNILPLTPSRRHFNFHSNALIVLCGMSCLVLRYSFALLASPSICGVGVWMNLIFKLFESCTIHFWSVLCLPGCLHGWNVMEWIIRRVWCLLICRSLKTTLYFVVFFISPLRQHQLIYGYMRRQRWHAGEELMNCYFISKISHKSNPSVDNSEFEFEIKL